LDVADGLLAGPRPPGLGDRVEARVRAVPSSDLRTRLAVNDDHVGREVVLASDQHRADTVRVDRDALTLELADALDVEAAGHHDPDVLEALTVEGLAHLPHDALVHASGVEFAHLLPERAVDQLTRGVEPYAPETLAERPRHLQRGPHAVVLEVHEHDHVHARALPFGPVDELRRGEDGVTGVGRDQPVRHRADPSPSPPRRLRVRRDADRTGHVRRIAVAGLHVAM